MRSSPEISAFNVCQTASLPTLDLQVQHCFAWPDCNSFRACCNVNKHSIMLTQHGNVDAHALQAKKCCSASPFSCCFLCSLSYPNSQMDWHVGGTENTCVCATSSTGCSCKGPIPSYSNKFINPCLRHDASLPCDSHLLAFACKHFVQQRFQAKTCLQASNEHESLSTCEHACTLCQGASHYAYMSFNRMAMIQC